MEFRPCIDIHNGCVKQIVGGSLKDEGNQASENFVSEQDAAFYAELYRKQGIRGGHVILLNKEGSEYYEATRQQAFGALRAYPGGLQIGGGIHPENAEEYLDAGASHVIVTSYVFRDGQMDREHLNRMVRTVGPGTFGTGFELPQKRRSVLHCNRPVAEVHECGTHTGSA